MHEARVIEKVQKLVSRKIGGSNKWVTPLNFYIDLDYKHLAFPIGKAVYKEEESLLCAIA